MPSLPVRSSNVLSTNRIKVGLEVNVGSLRGFLPASQVDLYFVGDLEPFVGQKLTVQITEVNPKKRNLVVSRRKYLESEREEIQKELWEKLAIGQELTGTVKNIKDYGALLIWVALMASCTLAKSAGTASSTLKMPSANNNRSMSKF